MYVQRTEGKVTGIYTNRQTGIAEELLPDDHPDVLGYLNPPPPSRGEKYNQLIKANPLFQALIDGLNDGTFACGSSYSPAQIKAIIESKLK